MDARACHHYHLEIVCIPQQRREYAFPDTSVTRIFWHALHYLLHHHHQLVDDPAEWESLSWLRPHCGSKWLLFRVLPPSPGHRHVYLVRFCFGQKLDYAIGRHRISLWCFGSSKGFSCALSSRSPAVCMLQWCIGWRLSTIYLLYPMASTGGHHNTPIQLVAFQHQSKPPK